MSARLLLTTAPDRRTSRVLARRLVEERLAACVTVVPSVESTYRWRGKIERGAECLLLIKTTARRTPECRRRLESLHPYEVPEILVLTPSQAAAPYLRWLESSVAA